MARAPINPLALSWAREVNRVSIDELAHAAGVKVSRAEEFENGRAMPTFRQLTLLATKLDRPLGFFFAPPPAVPDVPGTADFRGRPHGDLPADLAKEMRRAEQYREAMLDLRGRPERRLSIDAIEWSTIAHRARELRHQFGLTDAFVPAETSLSQVFNFWRGLVESHGVLVLQTTKIPLGTFRGLSIHHDKLPIIIINGADSITGRIFTLFHEVAHLANRTSGLCSLHETVDVEAVANSFAANFLMPEPALRATLIDADDPFAASERVALHFKVSSLAAAVRLRRLGLIDEEDLDGVRAASEVTWEQAREAVRKRDGHVPQWRLRYRDLGPTYIGTVAQALEDQRVDLIDATYLLNARLPTVEQMLNEYYRTGSSE